MATDETALSGRPGRLHVALLVVAVSLVFSNTLGNSYHLDDTHRVAGNPEVERFWPPWRHFTDPRTISTMAQVTNFRPLLPLSLSVTSALSDQLGLDRLAGHHLGNIVLHAAASVLVYLLLCELLLHWPSSPRRRRGPGVAFTAALLFAVHPISGVPVNYIGERELTLMLLFLAASLLAYARMRRRGASAIGWALVLTLYTLSLLAKLNGAVAPLLVAGFELLVARQPLGSWRVWARAAAFTAPVLALFAYTRWVLGFSEAAIVTSRVYSTWTYALTMADVHLFYYLRNVVWPFRMRAMPGVEPVTSPLDPGFLAGALFILATLSLAWRLRRREPLFSWAILGYWLLLAPSSSVLPLHHLAVDYRPYPALPFLFLAAVCLTTRLPPRLPALLVVVSLALYLGAASFAMNRAWATPETLWERSVRLGPSRFARMKYALAIQQRDPQLAERHYRQVLAEDPRHYYTLINFGMLAIRQGRGEEGLAYVRQAADQGPRWALSHHWLSRAYRELGRPVEAQQASRRAADLDPRNLQYQYQAAWDLQGQGDLAGSLPYLDRISELAPGYRLTRFLRAFALQRTGRWREAEPVYRQFLEQHPDSARGWYNLGWGQMREGRCPEAVASFERVVALGGVMAPHARRGLAECAVPGMQD